MQNFGAPVPGGTTWRVSGVSHNRTGCDAVGWHQPGNHVLADEEAELTGPRKIAIGVAVVGFILLFINVWLGIVVIAAAIAVPVGAYLMLDPSQRRRLKRIRRRQIGG
jgi:hypothetical protein